MTKCKARICGSDQPATLSVHVATALHLATLPGGEEEEWQPLDEILHEVKQLISNAQLSMREFRTELSDWAKEGWVVLSATDIHMTPKGRKQIRAIAEATA